MDCALVKNRIIILEQNHENIVFMLRKAEAQIYNQDYLVSTIFNEVTYSCGDKKKDCNIYTGHHSLKCNTDVL